VHSPRKRAVMSAARHLRNLALTGIRVPSGTSKEEAVTIFASSSSKLTHGAAFDQSGAALSFRLFCIINMMLE
jgi:hypothetical protein